MMDRHWAYCSACDRQVEVVVRPRPEGDPATGGDGEEVVCLEVGHTCTGALCPITDMPPDEMREALRRIRGDEQDDQGEG
jgi:hypothetical protein